MESTGDDWIVWDGSRLTKNGPEAPYDHRLVEVKYDGQSATKAAPPETLRGQSNHPRCSWRPMIWARDGANARVVFESPTPEAILEGLDGFLFLRIQSAFEQIYEGLGFSDLGATRWVEHFHHRLTWCTERGIQFRLLVVPESMAVYNDMVPGCPEPSRFRPMRQIRKHASENLNAAILYPRNLLNNARAETPTFHSDDVHFTSYGAYICYRALMRSLPNIKAEHIITRKALDYARVRFAGGLGRMLNREIRMIERYTAPVMQTNPLVKDHGFAPGKVDVVETENHDFPSMVIFRSSNSTAMFPFFLHHLSRLVAVAGPWFFEDLIESERPDIVILEMPERHLAPNAVADRYNEDEPRLIPINNFEEVTSLKLPLPGRRRQS